MTKKTTPPAAEKTIVLTMYGKDDAVTELTVNLFKPGAAKRYCRNTNDLQLKGGKWVHASIAEESAKIMVKKPPTAGTDIGILKKLDDRSIQRLFVELDSQTLVFALKNADKQTRDKVFRNMSRRAAEILQEDMEYMGPIPISKVREAQHEIASLLDKLVLNGKISVAGAR